MPICLLKRDRNGVDEGEKRNRNDLRGARGGETMIRINLMKKSIFNKIKIEKKKRKSHI